MTIFCSCGRIASSFVSDEPNYLGEGMCVYCAERIEKFAKRHGIEIYKSTIPRVHASEGLESPSEGNNAIPHQADGDQVAGSQGASAAGPSEGEALI